MKCLHLLTRWDPFLKAGGSGCRPSPLPKGEPWGGPCFRALLGTVLLNLGLSFPPPITAGQLLLFLQMDTLGGRERPSGGQRVFTLASGHRPASHFGTAGQGGPSAQQNWVGGDRENAPPEVLCWEALQRPQADWAAPGGSPAPPVHSTRPAPSPGRQLSAPASSF